MSNHLQPQEPRKNLLATASADRRNAERFPFSAVAEITEVSSKSKVSVRIADIGRHGCYADSLNVFPIGTRVRLNLRHDGGAIDISATVIYSMAGMGMGLNFAQMPRDMEATLLRWLSGIKGEGVAALESGRAGNVEERASSGARSALASLIKLMMRKGLLSDSESRNLLEELSDH